MPKNSFKEKKVSKTICLPRAIWEQIDLNAKKDTRSRSEYLLSILIRSTDFKRRKNGNLTHPHQGH